MANILDSLLGRIEDEQLRDALTTEVARLKDSKDFGLVFERHFPEGLRLPSAPVRRGSKVQLRDSDGSPTWTVRRVRDGNAELRAEDGTEDQRPVGELVVVREFGDPIYPGLRSLGSVGRGGDKAPHLVIKGENYHSLEMLQYTHAGKVDCIYIDPPYNTGAKDWKYNNDYVEVSDAYRHSKWLAFMERRLLLARNLLNPDNSVLIVTIDEKEYLRLGLLLGQIFPRATIQMVSSVINSGGPTRHGQVTRVDEYIFFIMFGTQKLLATGDSMLFMPPNEAEALPTSRRSKPAIWHSLLRGGQGARRRDSKNLFYPVFIDEARGVIVKVGDPIPLDVDRTTVKAPDGLRAVWPMNSNGEEGRWRISHPVLRDKLRQKHAKLGGYTEDADTYRINYLVPANQKRLETGEIVIVGEDDRGDLILEHAPDVERVEPPKSVWNKPSHNARAYGTDLVNTLIPRQRFPFPKSLYAVEDTLRFFVKDNPDAVIVDFFAGSGTTAHAVARLNKQDGGRRRSILVTNNEVSDDEAKALRKAGHQPGNPEWEALGIFEHITRPRITAAITGQTPEGDPIKGDYKFTDEFPMADGFEENVEYFELTYTDRNDIARGAAFETIAPLLWLKAGGQGPVIDKPAKGWAAPDGANYAVLFDPGHSTALLEELTDRPEITHVFIITDSSAQYQQVRSQLSPQTETTMLYDNLLRNFEINTGALS